MNSKIIKVTIVAFLLFMFGIANKTQAQDCFVLEYRNILPTGCNSANNSFTGFSFEVWASAAPCYTGNLANWIAMNIRVDATVGNNNILSVSNEFNPASVTLGTGVTAVPGAPPIGSSEFGLNYLRDAQPDITATPVMLGKISVSLVAPITNEVTLNTRTATSSTGTFYSNIEMPGVRLGVAEPTDTRVITCTALPVTLVNFSVKKEGSTALIDWETTSETNSDHFDVEQSANGRNWYRLTTLSAAGESQSRLKYSYSDQNPLAGENLYRLRMVDRDGTFGYSSIRSVTFDTSSATAYPNPAKNQLSIKGLEASKVKKISFIAVDGKELLSSNSITNIDISSLPNGLYVVKAYRQDGVNNIFKVIVNK